MEQRPVIHNTFVIERSYPAKPERVFAAFSDPAKKRRWFVEKGHNDIDHYELDFRIGGVERARFRFTAETPVKGLVCATDTTYLDIVPNHRIVFAASMIIAQNCISATLCTVELAASETGTDLLFTHQGAFFEGADGPEMRQAGWVELFNSLSAELAR
jgi:uncharacterized protein YndB with AHSA1/START domain